MKVFIAGGTGLVGSRLAVLLQDAGHEVVIGSRSRGFDIASGEGVRAALEGVHTVVDVLNGPAHADETEEFFRRTTEVLVEEGRAAGVSHHVVLSIVGIDLVPRVGYAAGKVAQEETVRGSGLPYSILRATQFFEWIGTMADQMTVDGEVLVPKRLLQPIALGDLTEVLAEVTTGDPLNAVVDVAGPDRIPFDELVSRTLARSGDARPIVVGPPDGYEDMVPRGGFRAGRTRFTDYLDSV